MENTKIQRFSIINSRLNLAITLLVVAILFLVKEGSLLSLIASACVFAVIAILFCVKAHIRKIFKEVFVKKLEKLVERTLKDYVSNYTGFKVKAINSFKYEVIVHEDTKYEAKQILKTLIDINARDTKMHVKVNVEQVSGAELVRTILGPEARTYTV